MTSYRLSILLALAVSSADAAVSYTPGDILVGFQAAGGQGAGQNYVFNLGQGSIYRDNPSVGSIANLGTDLAAVYGSNWFSRPDLSWAIGGVRTNASFGSASTTVLNGDPGRAVYVGKGAVSIGSSDPIILGNASAVTTGASEMMDTQSGFATTNGTTPRTETPTSGGRGTIQGTGDINSWSSKVDAAPWGVFTGAVKGSFGTGGTEAYMDLYRILARNDLPGTAEVAPVGQGTWQTTFTIDALGNLSAVPEPSAAIMAAGSLLLLTRRRRSL